MVLQFMHHYCTLCIVISMLRSSKFSELLRQPTSLLFFLTALVPLVSSGSPTEEFHSKLFIFVVVVEQAT